MCIHIRWTSVLPPRSRKPAPLNRGAGLQDYDKVVSIFAHTITTVTYVQLEKWITYWKRNTVSSRKTVTDLQRTCILSGSLENKRLTELSCQVYTSSWASGYNKANSHWYFIPHSYKCHSNSRAFLRTLSLFLGNWVPFPCPTGQDMDYNI